MMRSLYSAVSGMAANTLRLDVIGNNIANVNTVGFKSARVNFQETLGQVQQAATAPTDTAGGSNAIMIGTGTLASAVDQLYTQGSLQMTGVHTDLAMQGNGLFVVSNGEMNLYTRDGSFSVDSLGRMVGSGSALVVQGYTYDNVNGVYGSGLEDVYLPMKDVEPAKSTTTVNLSGNLDADSEPIGSYMKTSVLYNNGGSFVDETTALVNLRQEATGVGTLVEAGDTVYVGAVVGDEAISGSLAVTAGTTLSELASTIQSVLNTPPEVSGITVNVGTDGRLYVETPDQMGTSAEIKSLNLSASDVDGVTRGTFSAAVAFSDIEVARDAGTFMEETTVYDALGFDHAIKFTFTRVEGLNEFTWEAEVDDGETEILTGGTGRVALRVDGSLDALVYDAAGSTVPTSISFNPGTGAESPLNVQLDVGTRGLFDGLTMLRGTQSLESSQDGYSKGTFTRFDIDESGRVMGVFSNGVIRPICQMAIAEFTNPVGLTRVGSNAYIESPNSGPPTVGISGEGIASTLTPGALEQSNVDLTREFTDMIVAQRGFQSSARVVTTTDEVLNELINIKR